MSINYEFKSEEGTLSIEKLLPQEICLEKSTIGVQVSDDGRVWICVNGEAFLRFKPLPKALGSHKCMI